MQICSLTAKLQLKIFYMKIYTSKGKLLSTRALTHSHLPIFTNQIYEPSVDCLQHFDNHFSSMLNQGSAISRHLVFFSLVQLCQYFKTDKFLLRFMFSYIMLSKQIISFILSPTLVFYSILSNFNYKKQEAFTMQNPQNKPKVPNHICEQILNYQLEIQLGNITQDLICKVIELYMEAMNIYTSHPSYSQTMTQARGMQRDERNSVPFISRGHEFYQDKIKKLLIRKDVQKCLVGGYRVNQKAIDLQHQIQKIEQSAPEQAKALLEYFKRFHKEQQKLIEKAVEQQNARLQERIQRRSRSKSNRGNSPLKQNKSFVSNLNFPICGSKHQKNVAYKNLGVNLGI